MTDQNDLRERVAQVIENLRGDSGVSSVEVADAALAEIGEVSVRDAARVALERFESCASGLVSDDYARGYREACDHIGQDAARAITEGKDDDKKATPLNRR